MFDRETGRGRQRSPMLRYNSRGSSPPDSIRQRFSYSRSPSPEPWNQRRMNRCSNFYTREQSPTARDYRPTRRGYGGMARSSSREYSPMSRDYGSVSRDRSPMSRDYGSVSRERSPYTRNQSPMIRRGKRRMQDSIRGMPERRHVDEYEYHVHSYYDDLSKYDKRGYSPYGTDRYAKCHDKNPMSGRKWTEHYNNGTSNNACFEHLNRSNWMYENIFTKSENINAPLSPVICHFYNNGECREGSSCKFLHLCKYFIADDCKYGMRCKRSHDIFEEQPRSVLEKCGWIPDGYYSDDTDNDKVIDSVKQKLKNVPVHSKRRIDRRTAGFGLPQTATRPSFAKETSFLDESDEELAPANKRQNDAKKLFSAEVDSSDGSQSDRKKNHHDGSQDYIPLVKTPKMEKNRKKTDKTKRKMKKDKKSNRKGKSIKCKNEGDTDRLVLNQDNESNADDTAIQCSITFDSQRSESNFKARQIRDQWQISTIYGTWRELSVDQSEVFSELYRSASEIREKILPQE